MGWNILHLYIDGMASEDAKCVGDKLSFEVEDEEKMSCKIPISQSLITLEIDAISEKLVG